MIRSFVTVASGTLASRLLGFVRDSFIAALLGAGPVADAFLVAFQLINVIRRLLAEGGLNAALVPAWLSVRERDGRGAAAAFAGRVLATLGVALAAVALLIGVVMPVVVAALAPGFTGTDALALAVRDGRLMLPYVAFAGPVTVMMALLNARGRFVLTAFSPLLFNVALIAATLVLLVWRQDPAGASAVLAATIGAAGLMQLFVLAFGSGRAATPLRLSFDSEMRGFFGRAIPGMIASSAPQWLMVAGAIAASTSPAAVSWLYFANRLLELPLGIVGVAMGTILIPEMSRALRGDDPGAIAHAESRALELAVGLAVPAAIGLIVLNEPIVRILFEHGAFTQADSAATAQALVWLALGLPAHVLVKALSPAFYARQDTKTPLIATLNAIAVTLGGALLLGHLFGPNGIAAAIALGAWSNALCLIWAGAKTFGFSIDLAARMRLPRIVASAAAMGALLWLIMRLEPIRGPHSLAQLLPLVPVIAGAVAVYGLLLKLFGVLDWREALDAIRQKRAA